MDTIMCPRCIRLKGSVRDCPACKRLRAEAAAKKKQPELPMPTLEFHPLANLFPLMPDAELVALGEDIEANGLRDPIWLFEGKILDGRNRYLACIAKDIDHRVEYYRGKDALGFVLSKNLHRRHLSTSQRAMIAAELLNLRPTDANLRPTVDQAAKALNVSPRSVDSASKVLEQAAPKLVNAVKAGEVTVAAAEAVSDALPKKEQAAVVKSGTVPEVAKEQREAQAIARKREIMLLLIGTADYALEVKLRTDLLTSDEDLESSVPKSCPKCWKHGPPKSGACVACERLRKPAAFTGPEPGRTPDAEPHAELRHLVGKLSGDITKAVNDKDSEFHRRLHNYMAACGLLDHPPEKHGDAVFLPLKGVSLIIEWASKEGSRRSDADVKEAYDTASGGWIPPVTKRRRAARGKK